MNADKESQLDDILLDIGRLEAESKNLARELDDCEELEAETNAWIEIFGKLIKRIFDL